MHLRLVGEGGDSKGLAKSLRVTTTPSHLNGCWINKTVAYKDGGKTTLLVRHMHHMQV